MAGSTIGGATGGNFMIYLGDGVYGYGVCMDYVEHVNIAMEQT